MARRKSKRQRPEDTSIYRDSSPPQPRRRINSTAPPALLFIVFTVGSSVMASFCLQQQHSLDQLTESFTTMQETVTVLHQVMEMPRAQTDLGLDVVERIFALEEAQKQAQERARVALDTSEKITNPDFYSQLWALRGEMDTQLAEIKQVTLSLAALQALFKNQSEEFEAVKESLAAGLRSSSALAEDVAGLANAVANAYSRADEQIASVEALIGQLDGHALELNELKESVHLHNGALYRNKQELTAMRELVEAKRAMRAQALEEMLSSILKTLDEQFFTSQSLHSSVLAQLRTFHTQDATGVLENLSDVEAEAEREDNEDEAEEETMQEEPPLTRAMEGDITEQGEKDITPEEHKDEEITGQNEEQEVSGETAEEEVSEETVDSYVWKVSQ